MMGEYIDYIQEIKDRKDKGLNPKPIDGSKLLNEIILQIKDINHIYRKQSLDFYAHR